MKGRFMKGRFIREREWETGFNRSISEMQKNKIKILCDLFKQYLCEIYIPKWVFTSLPIDL